ncbi:MAG TPA: type II secretion system protein GspK [Verrucomicrobiae bacterium]|nr:type II secretion system protein GspK [Verrucomicrobiae bacterium]
MNPALSRSDRAGEGHTRRGSVLIIVLWIALGLVALALYFAQSMNLEMRASDNRVSAQAADQAIEGAVRYVNYLLTYQIANGSNGCVPDINGYVREAVPVGDAHFWLIGRDTNAPPGQVFFGLVDEASKLNLNTAPSNSLVWLPRMTPDFTQAILDWRDTNATGPTVMYYSMQQPAYQCKSDPFETVDELRMVYGANMDLLVGEDVNRNGVLDPSENDDNQNNLLDPGILECVTVYSREPNTNKVLINPANVSANGPLDSMLRTALGASRAAQLLARFRGAAGGGGGPGGGRNTNQVTTTQTVRFASPLQFYLATGMTASEFAQVATNLTTTNSTYIEGRINVNTASAAVLACLLNGDMSAAQQLVDYRQSNPTDLGSIAWIITALGQNASTYLQTLQSWDCLTTQSYQFTADVAALGPHGRGYRRVRYVFDTSSGAPQIVYRQDLTSLGWALGKTTRQKWIIAKGTS